MPGPTGNMKTIAEAAEGVILALTPRVETSYPFVALPEDAASLEDARLASDEALRRVLVYGEPDPRPLDGHWNGPLVEVEQTLVVELRYVCPDTRGGLKRAQRTSSVDAAQITGALLEDYPWAGEDTLTQIRPNNTPRLRAKGQGVYTVRLEFRATYFHEVDAS